MLKKLLCACLCLCLLLSMLSGCSGSPTATTPQTTSETETETKPTETPEEANALRIMIIGSSRSVNTFQLLYPVFKDQMPDKEITLGVMYYTGGSMIKHANFIRNNEAAITYYRNTNGYWELIYNSYMQDGLKDQNWDVVLLQAGTGDQAGNMNLEDRKFITSCVDSWVSHPHSYWWHTTWFNASDPSLYEKPNDVISEAEQYGQLKSQINAAKQYVMDDPMFEGRICSGTPLMYALKVLGVPEDQLFRDHTHLSDYGSLLIGYCWYVQFTGQPVTEINLDKIPQLQRNLKQQHLGDLEITEEMKQVILKTAQYTYENPWTIPVK